MELMQIPTHYRDNNGNLQPIEVDPGKLIVHHISKMTEHDWTVNWEMPPKKRSIRVNRIQLDNPILNDMLFAYQQEVDMHKEWGTPIVSPNPMKVICGYIFNNYSYPEDDSNIIVPYGFIIEEPDAILAKRLRRIEVGMEKREADSTSSQKDKMMEEYQIYLISKGVEPHSKEYVEKSVEYWNSLKGKNPVEGVPPSKSKEVFLTTSKRSYTRKALRARFRYLYETEMEYCLSWAMQHPLTDLQTYDGKAELVKDFDEGIEP